MSKINLNLLQSENFRNLDIKKGVRLADLNIFIGPNCSGKSNFISVLKFLKDCLVSGSSDEQEGKYENAVGRLGGAGMLDKSVSPRSDVRFLYNFSSEKISRGLNLDVRLFIGAGSSKVTVSEESLSSDSLRPGSDRPFCYYRYHDKEIGKGVVSYYNESDKETSCFENISNIPNNSLGLGLTHRLLAESRNPPERIPVYKIAGELRDTVAGWHFYNSNDMNLKKIRNAEPKTGPGDMYLSESGHNLALVIENLIQRDIAFEESLNKAMRSVLPTTRRLRPARTGLMSVNLQWHFEGFEEPLYLNEMSDGAVRMLCWAAILLSPRIPGLLVIDEPELGVHVSWLPILAEWIKAASRRTQVIICTHSPDLLDYFTDHIANILCFSSGDRKHFSVSPLSEARLLRSLEEGWKIGDLYRVGDPGVGGWPW